MKARDLMSRPAITCHVNDTLNAAARLMWDYDCGAAVVVDDDGKLASMITDRDVCMAAMTQGEPLGTILVNRAMARHVVSASPETTVGELEHLMSAHQIRRIPIVDSDGRPIGVVSLNDLALKCATMPVGRDANSAHLTQTLAAIGRHRVGDQAA